MFDSGIAWTALAAIVTLHVLMGTILVRLVNRLNNSDSIAKEAKSRADLSAVSVAAINLEIERLEGELTDHRVATAEKYVSKETLASLENRIVDAIRSLGDRIDNMLNGRSPK